MKLNSGCCDLADKIAITFAWPNARAKCHTAEPATVEYHLWTLHASLQSEDVWESIVRVGVNAESQAIVPLQEVLRETDLIGADSATALDELFTRFIGEANDAQRRDSGVRDR